MSASSTLLTGENMMIGTQGRAGLFRPLDAAAWEDIRVAMQHLAFRVVCPAAHVALWRTTLKHRCSSKTCSFLRHGDVYVCNATGQIHLCGRAYCDRREETRESEVCQVTARDFPLGRSSFDVTRYSIGSGESSGRTTASRSFRSNKPRTDGVGVTVHESEMRVQGRKRKQAPAVAPATAAATAKRKTSRGNKSRKERRTIDPHSAALASQRMRQWERQIWNLYKKQYNNCKQASVPFPDRSNEDTAALIRRVCSALEKLWTKIGYWRTLCKERERIVAKYGARVTEGKRAHGVPHKTYTPMMHLVAVLYRPPVTIEAADPELQQFFATDLLALKECLPALEEAFGGSISAVTGANRTYLGFLDSLSKPE